jgi:hypothetical protein
MTFTNHSVIIEFTIIDQYEAWMQIIISLNLQQIHQARYLIDVC